NKVSHLLLLQPTCPLRTSSDIDQSIEHLLSDKDADSLTSVTDCASAHPCIVYRFDGDLVIPFLKDALPTRRQDFAPAYVRNGAIYLVARKVIMDEYTFFGSRLLGYQMPRSRSVNLDEPIDLLFAEALLKSEFK